MLNVVNYLTYVRFLMVREQKSTYFFKKYFGFWNLDIFKMSKFGIWKYFSKKVPLVTDFVTIHIFGEIICYDIFLLNNCKLFSVANVWKL
jgi:hypothetical protein